MASFRAFQVICYVANITLTATPTFDSPAGLLIAFGTTHCYVSMTMADAAYFHATLYKFDAQAQGEVVKRLNAGVDNVLVRCWYDETRDVRTSSFLSDS